MEAELVRQTLAGILDPVREAREVAQREVERAEAELERRRADLRTLDRVLKAADPLEKKPGKPGPKPGHLATSNGTGVSAQMLEHVRQWLREHAAEYPDGFIGSRISRDGKDELPSDATVGKALAALRETGELRLVGTGSGGAKIYKLVA